MGFVAGRNPSNRRALSLRQTLSLLRGRPLSRQGQAVIAGLVAPGIDAAEVIARPEVWAELRANFPRSAYLRRLNADGEIE